MYKIFVGLNFGLILSTDLALNFSLSDESDLNLSLLGITFSDENLMS